METGYKDLPYIGTLDKIIGSDTVFRGRELDAPDAVRITRIQLKHPNGGGACFEVYGRVASQHIGTPTRVLNSYEKLPNGMKKFRTQMFVDCDPTTFEGGEEIIDMTVRRTY